MLLNRLTCCCGGSAFLTLVLVFSVVSGFAAEEPSSPVVCMVKVPVPITGTVDTQVQRAITRSLDSTSGQAAGRTILVLQFTPDKDPLVAADSQFERSLSLARFLAGLELNDARIVAYLPETIQGHAVLPILACEELIMHPDAKIGAAGIQESVIDPTMREGYRELAERRRTVPTALAEAMLDKSQKLYKATTAAGTRYVLASELEELKKETTVQELDTVVDEGDVALFSGRALRVEHAIVAHLANDQRDLSVALGVPAAALQWNPGLTEDWHPIRTDVTGPIRGTQVDRVQRGLEDSLRDGNVNFVCVWLDSPGGSPHHSIQLASYLARLDNSRIHTVAFVPREARGDAALIAMACDELVMQDGAVLGGPGAFEPSPEQVQELLAAAKDIAQQKSRPWSATAAMVDGGVQAKLYRRQGTTAAEILTGEELSELRDPAAWVEQRAVTNGETPLSLTDREAVDLGVARDHVQDFGQFRGLFALQDDPTLVQPNWAHELIEQLARPHIAGALLFVALAALIAEAGSPGLGAGGFVSLVSFVLFFWSKHLNGTANGLELLLFATGVACVAAEIFVLPGFGVFGFGGAALILVSLILASQTFVVPQNDYQMEQLYRSLLMVVAALAGIVAGIVLLRQYVGQLPFLQKIRLAPPEGELREQLSERESLVKLDYLVGQTGRTVTPLRPSGKAKFADRLVDVISDGEVIEAGIEVHVVRVQGNRVLVEVRA